MDTIVIDLSDPKTLQVATLAAIAWGISVALVLYNIASDIVTLIRSRQPKRKAVERRFIEPCADDLHIFEDGACSRCKAVQPLP